MHRALLKRRLERLSFFEWAYGHLAESDSDIGVVGEYLVGKALRCLPARRRVNARYDLVLPDGRGIEVKTTTVWQATAAPVHCRWNVRTQLSSSQSLADVWIFLLAAFPSDSAARKDFDVFDPRYWSFRLATADQMRSSGVRVSVSDKTLDRLGVPLQPLNELGAAMAHMGCR